jgi:dynein light intermediate chain 1, cytosolic
LLVDGAALVYTSAKDEKNLDVLLKYALHRLYGTRCERAPYVVEKDCVFVPSGWDTLRKIAIMFENMNALRPDLSFDDAFARLRLARAAQQRERVAVTNSSNAQSANLIDVVVEDEQVFLTRMQTALLKVGEQPGTQQQPGTLQPQPSIAIAQPNAQSSPLNTTMSVTPDMNASTIGVAAGANRTAPVRPVYIVAI